MRTLKLIIASILAISLFACRDSFDIGNTNGEVKIVAELSQPSSRTTYAEDNGVVHVAWQADDEIGIFTPTQKNLKYLASNDGSSTNLVADGEKIDVQDGDTIFAYYPYNRNAAEEEFSCNLIVQYSYKPVSERDYMYASGVVKDGKVSLQFKHVCAFLKINFADDDNDKSLRILARENNASSSKLSITNNQLAPTDFSSWIYYKVTKPDSLNYVYVATLPLSEDTQMYFIKDNNTDDYFSKSAPKGGIQAGRIYEVSFDKEITEFEAIVDKHRAALIDLYNATGGKNWWRNYNWCTDLPLHEWYGNSCFVNNLINGWDLSWNNLAGKLPESFADLMSYEYLDISDNNLYGDIPASVTSHENWNKFWACILYDNKFNLNNVPAPKFSVTDMNGNTLTSDVYAQNKLTILCSWRTDSEYYITETKNYVSLYEKYHDKGLEIIGFECGDKMFNGCNNTRESVEKDIAEYGIKWQNVLATGTENNMNMHGGSQCYIVNSSGEIVYMSSTDSNQDPKDFVYEYYGDDTSTDFSADGDVFRIQKATVGKGIDLVFIGDGFIDQDMESGGKYEQKMREATDIFFSYEPYKTFRNRFNVYGVKAVSANSKWVGNVDHAIGTSVSKAFEYAKCAVGDTDQPLRVAVIYNTDKYIARSYTNMYTDDSYVGFVMTSLSFDANVLVHECAGHGFGKLLDEYVEPGYETTAPSSSQKNNFDSQLKNYGWGGNVDWRNDLSTIRWAHMIADGRYANEGIGVYEGAATYGLEMYRPTENSMMRNNDSPFNAPSREQIYKNIMKCSEGDAWTYDYEKFVEYDAINRNATTSRALKTAPSKSARQAHAKSHRPPVLINGSWHDYVTDEKVKSRKKSKK